jgi:hypothetical protein
MGRCYDIPANWSLCSYSEFGWQSHIYIYIYIYRVLFQTTVGRSISTTLMVSVHKWRVFTAFKLKISRKTRTNYNTKLIAGNLWIALVMELEPGDWTTRESRFYEKCHDMKMTFFSSTCMQIGDPWMNGWKWPSQGFLLKRGTKVVFKETKGLTLFIFFYSIDYKPNHPQ